MHLLAAKSCGGAEGDGKTAIVLEPRRGRSDYCAKKALAARATSMPYVSWN
jgi:hypothetical protein